MNPLARLITPALNRAGYDLIRVPRRLKSEKASGIGYFETEIGNYYVPLEAPSDDIARAMRRGEIFEPEVVDIAKRFIKPGTVAIDAGANLGQMSLLFAKFAGPSGYVISIEAQRRVYEILERNIAANNAGNVLPQFIAAYHRSGETFHFPPPDFAKWASYGSFNLPLDSQEGDEVISKRIDDIAMPGQVSFMKVDVQGCDLFAMQGAVDTINKYRMPILFEFEQRYQKDYGTRFQDYVDFVSSIDYEFTETILDINFLVEPKRA